MGPGTGVFTRQIVSLMGPDDRLDIYEINERFLDHVGELRDSDPHFAEARERIQLHHLDARFIETDESYDFLVSGLPFNNFDPELVGSILEAYFRVVREGGWISFFEYVAARVAKRLVSSTRARSDIDGISSILKEYFKKYRQGHEVILPNIPPAYVHHLQNPGTGGAD